MNIVVTAGNTQVLIDRVRCITNIFSGKTGTSIALAAHARGHDVTLLTSHPEVVATLAKKPPETRWRVEPYRTFEDLEALMQRAIRDGSPDVVVHSAAVSDYRAAGVFAPDEHTRFRHDLHWESTGTGKPRLVDRWASKVKSDASELWLRLVRSPKLIDMIRSPWHFQGILVKFKLEVDIDEEALRRIAEESRKQSQADLMVANTLEGAQSWALLGPIRGDYLRVDRPTLPARLLNAIEGL
ncbi:MAG: phosphopantothenoylcysteine decarboxylase [Gemmataceae bacterium]